MPAMGSPHPPKHGVLKQARQRALCACGRPSLSYADIMSRAYGMSRSASQAIIVLQFNATAILVAREGMPEGPYGRQVQVSAQPGSHALPLHELPRTHQVALALRRLRRTTGRSAC